MQKFQTKLIPKLPYFFVLMAAIFYLTAFTVNGIDESTTTPKAEIGPDDWKDYKKWTKITKEPNTGDPTGFLDKKHRGESAFRDVFVNSVGETTMKGDTGFPYPAGTIIVKEAFKNQKDYDAQKKPELTIMIKLAEGEAPDTNNWEFVMGADGKFRGKGMDTKWGKFCGSCHVNAIAKDFTFMAESK